MPLHDSSSAPAPATPSHERSSLSLLAQPAWWAALAVLLVNDHVLKGSGLLPGWLTGKLSDVAGLVVGPVLLVALTGSRSRRARAASLALVAFVFAAIKLSPPAAHLLESAMSLVGLRWRIWVDPTDLLAFTALPLAWRLTGPRSSTSNSPTRYVVARSGLILGAFACIATSQMVIPSWTSRAFVVNRSGSTQIVGVQRPLVGVLLDCDAVERDPTRALSPTLFGSQTLYRLDDDATLPLDFVVPALSDMRPDTTMTFTAAPAPPECDAALITVTGLPDTVIVWRRGVTESVLTDDYPTATPTPATVALERASGVFSLELGTGVFSANADETVETGTCNLPASQPDFTWTHLPNGYDVVTVLERTSRDGCVVLRVDDDSSASPPREWQLCVPDEAVPFQPGEVLSIFDEPQTLTVIGSRMLTIALDRDHVTELDAGLSQSNTLIPDDCTAQRLECGAFVRSATLDLSDVTLPEGTQLFLGPAHDVQVVGSTCDYPSLGSRLSYAWGQDLTL